MFDLPIGKRYVRWMAREKNGRKERECTFAAQIKKTHRGNKCKLHFLMCGRRLISSWLSVNRFIAEH